MSEIYHYTTLEKLINILHCKKDDRTGEIKDVDRGRNLIFYASDVRVLNNSLENKLIQDAFQTGINNKPRIEFARGSAYSISFCRQRDYIPMWNMCVQNSDDVGICLGFSTDKLAEWVQKVNGDSFSRLELCDCRYVTETGLKRKIISGIKDFKKSSGIESYNSDLLKERLNRIIVQSASLRLNDFMYEKEERIIGIIDGEKYVNGAWGGVVPYRQIKIPIYSLKEIIISPHTKNKDIIKMGIEAILQLKSCNLKKYGIEVECSKLELR